jgi:hypothetical protein
MKRMYADAQLTMPHSDRGSLLGESKSLAQSTDRPAKTIDKVMDAHEKQLHLIVETMRRIEDLSDRICGAVSVGAGDKTPDRGEGIVAALMRIHDDRDEALRRIVGALDRIDSVL